ncbi:MAG: lytic transglycosylase F, partial [Ignavibacteria bacterium RBG_13_36_8]
MRTINIIVLLVLLICGCRTVTEQEKIADFDLDKMLKRGSIKAITGYNAYSYFIYKGEPMGFEYELVKKYADYLGVKLEIIIIKEMNKMFEALNSGEGDIIAFNLTVTKDRMNRAAFTNTLNSTKQVLVQLRPKNWQSMTAQEIDKQLVRNPIDLEGKTVYVRGGSSHLQRLINLSDEIGGDINIIEADPELTMEDLIQMVAEGEIDYTVADENVALLNQAYYSNIDVVTELSFPQKIAWGIRKNAARLLNDLNTWIDSEKKKNEFYVIRSKYFENRRAYITRLTSKYFSQTGGNISQYDNLIKQYAKDLHWDWRLLASMIYQESQFDPNARSWAGAQGIMQLMPATAKMYGLDSLSDVRQNISAGINYLMWLDKYWYTQVPDSSERVKLVLASYNIGIGHVIDAKNLAEKFGVNPTIWDNNVERYLLLKSKEKYFSDEVVQYGFCRGIETVNYVKEILERY